MLCFRGMADGGYDDPPPCTVTGSSVTSSMQEASETPTISVSTQLVVEAVTVKDKKGNPIEGLTAKDFTITENGVAQTIRFCEHQQLPETLIAASEPPPTSENIKIYDTLARTRISASSPGNIRYKDRRLLALYFDMTAMQPVEQMRALAAAKNFIRTQMTPADLLSILRYQGAAVDVLQDFTADRNRLLSIVETMIVGEGQGFGESSADAGTPDVGRRFRPGRQRVQHLQHRSPVVRAPDGRQDVGTAEREEITDLLRQRSEAEWHEQPGATPRDHRLCHPRRGVVLADRRAWSGGRSPPWRRHARVARATSACIPGAAALAVTTNFQQSQDTLYALAGDTGGKALLDYNDLTKGIVQAQKNVSSYYILGYYTSNAAQDGKFRRIKISVNESLSANLDYRQGYYAGKLFSKFTAADKERQLEDALMLDDPITELTIAMEIDYFQLNRAEYFVPIVVKIPGRELALAKRGGAEHTLIDFIGEIKDDYSGMTVTNVRDKVNIKLSDATAAELSKRPIEYDTGFTLLPGKYTIKFLARDDETGRIGTYQATFVIPNLNKEEKRIANQLRGLEQPAHRA